MLRPYPHVLVGYRMFYGRFYPEHWSTSGLYFSQSSAHIDAGWVGVGWGGVGCNNVPCTPLPLTCSLHPSLGQHGGVGVGWGGVQERTCAVRTDWMLTWYPLPLTCSLHPCLGQHGGVGVGWGGVGWGGVGCNNVLVHPLSTSTYLLTASMSWSAWGGGGGVGWGGVGCNNVLAQWGKTPHSDELCVDAKKKQQQEESCYRDTITKSHKSDVHRRPLNLRQAGASWHTMCPSPILSDHLNGSKWDWNVS